MTDTQGSLPEQQNNRSMPAFIAGIGMITPIGPNTAATSAAVTAGISAYTVSDYFTREGKPVTMSAVPEGVFSAMEIEIDEGDVFDGQIDHIIRMSILSLTEALSGQVITKPVPLIFALQETQTDTPPINTDTLMSNLIEQCNFPLDTGKAHFLPTGRAAGIHGLDLALRYLYEGNEDFVLIGGSDSYWSAPLISELEEAQRLHIEGSFDGFVPGEGAGFILLTRHANCALNENNHIVSLSKPGIAKEPGHFESDLPYLGDGLDLAFKQALSDYSGGNISAIYSSMNGERFWVKENSVATMRNKSHFKDSFTLEHPAECYGDLGAASAPVLMGLAATRLLKQTGPAAQLIYSSSDSAWRAAVRMEKIPQVVNNNKESQV